MNLIDTHTHLYATEFDNDRAEMIQRAENEGVVRMYLPAIDSSTHESMLQLEKSKPGTCLAMMGLHPCSVKENFRQELDIVRNYLEQRKFAAVGEIGLDFYWDRSFDDQQYEALKIQAEWAIEFNLPVVIHSRESVQQCIDVLTEYKNKGIRGIFHCFSGGAEIANQIIDLGFYLGIGGVLTYKNSGLAETLKNIDLAHVVLETDAPYLTPVPFRGKRNESSYLKYVVQKLAEVKSMGVEEVAEITTANAQKIFGS